MKISISCSAPSRSSRIVEAGRAVTASATKSARRAGLRLHAGPAIDPCDARQQVIHFRLCGDRDDRARLALRAGSNDTALLQHVFPDRQSNRRLLLVADQREMGVEQ